MINFLKNFVNICILLVLLSNTVQSDCLIDCCQTLSYRQQQTYHFYQNTGHFFGGQGEWQIDTYGYSGQQEGYLNPQMQCVSNKGPLPANIYTVAYCKNSMHDPPVVKPCAFYLSPNDQSKMCGRSDMFIHGCQCCTEGDTTVPPAMGCSAGCLIINLENRQKIRIGDQIIVKSYENNNKQQAIE